MKGRPIDQARYLAPHELKALRDHCRLHHDADLARGRRQGVLAWALIDTMLISGGRISEIVALNVGDLHRATKPPTLSMPRHKRKCGRDGRPPRESVIISIALARHLDLFIAWKDSRGEPIGADDALFCSKRRQRMAIRTAREIFYTYRTAAGLRDDLSPHCTRHTCAVQLLRATGGNIRAVQQHLGHTDLQSTQVYTAVMPDDMAAGVEKMYE